MTCREWKYYNHNQTFDYTLSSPNGIKDFEIKFTKGEYTINNIQVYTLDYNQISNLNNTVDEFKIDTKNTKGNKIKGSVNVTEAGYFNLTVPYDEGFEIKVDGKETKYEKVNGAFIGFPIEKGHHQIDITYTAPNFNLGKNISIIGFTLFIIIFVYDTFIKRKTKSKKTENILN